MSRLAASINNNEAERKSDNLIEANNGIINKYVNSMPTQDSRYLRQAFKAITPDVKIAKDFECPSCDHEQELEVSFGADFFWPDR